MGRPPTWTDAQLAAAIVGAPSWAEVTRRLGMNAYGKTTTRLRRHAARLGLDVSHLTMVRSAVTPAPLPDRGIVATPEELQGALALARSWAQVLHSLGFGPSSSNYAAVKRLAAEIDADVTNLLGQGWASIPIRPLPVPFSRPFDPARLRQVGTAAATTWFLYHGYMVSLPVEPTTYDLVAESDVGLQRVQVKTTRSMSVNITRTVYGSGSSPSPGHYGRIPYKPGELDLFFIYTLRRAMYLIPFAAVQGMRGLALKKYERYLLRDDTEAVATATAC
jgi:hypothetical protein